MPFTALYGDITLDATQEVLGTNSWKDFTWKDVFKRGLPLTCPSCGGGLHAKHSPLPHQHHYFAHNVENRNCILHGESLGHRLLKLELASAIRLAGWIATMEVAEEHWRADVLATSPDGERRIAFEAQLAPLTPNELLRRTQAYSASGVEVCWVSPKSVAWLGHAPSIQVERPPSDSDSSPPLSVVKGLQRFFPHLCPDPAACVVHPSLPCPGHGYWESAPLSLERFVHGVCLARIVSTSLTPAFDPELLPPAQGVLAWTAPEYLHLAEAERPHRALYDEALAALRARQVAAEARRRAEEAVERRIQEAERKQEEADAENRRRHVEALYARQRALAPLAVQFVSDLAGVPATLPKGPVADDFWAMGVRVDVEGKCVAVICPVASRIVDKMKWKMRHYTILVADQKERARMRRYCVPEQRVEVLPMDADTYERELAAVRAEYAHVPSYSSTPSLSISDVVRRMTGVGTRF